MADDTYALRRYVWITVGLALLGAGWYAGYAATGIGPVAVGYVFVPAGTAAAALSIRRLCATAPLEPAALRFWRRLLVALCCLTVGYTLYAVDVARHAPGAQPPVIPLAATGCLALGIVTAIWAVVRVPLGAAAGQGRWWPVMDRIIAFFGTATALWYFGLAPMLTAPEPWSAQAVFLIGLAFLLATGGAAKVSAAAPGPVHPTALRLVGLSGLVAAAVAVLGVALGRAGVVPAQAVVVPIMPVLVALAVRAQARNAPASRRADGLLPYLAIGAVDVPLLLVAAGPMRWTDRVLVVAAALVTALVAVRQAAAAREKRRLLSDREAQERRLQHQLTHDALTGLGNRALFRERLDAALRDGPGATVLLVDLDDFKTVNDSLGHDVGDELLVSVAGALRDATTHDGLPTRIGGDEFAVLLSGTAGSGAASGEAVAQRLLDVLGNPVGPHGLLVHASVGIASAGTGTPAHRILRNADVAMYAVKQSGKAGFLRYAAGMEMPVLAHAQLAGELRRGLDEGEFHVVYQPIIALDGGRVVGVEALARWNHPTRGAVSPAEFIPVAERTGLIVPLGRYVLRETCRQGAAWLAEFGPDALQKVGPNVSARQLHDPDFVSDVVDALADSGLPSDRLVLELTESAVLRGRQVSRTLHRLDRMGIKLALDDFGTGESSLSLLRSFPVAILKLDKSFADGVGDTADPGTSGAREAVARAVIQLAGALSLDAVAEGIENESQARRLRELGYTLGQGFHLARPMPADDLRRLLAAQRLSVPAA